MKRKVLTVSLLVCLLLLCMAGCDKSEKQQPSAVDEKTVTVIGAKDEGDVCSEGNFDSVDQNGSITSNAKELGGSKTLGIEYSDDETQPEDGTATVTEPQWQPGIW